MSIQVHLLFDPPPQPQQWGVDHIIPVAATARGNIKDLHTVLSTAAQM
jgi:hypothetical protein